MPHATTETVDRADRLAECLAVPVLVAALASIPATFLTLFDGAWAATGSALNLVSGGVLDQVTARVGLLGVLVACLVVGGAEDETSGRAGDVAA